MTAGRTDTERIHAGYDRFTVLYLTHDPHRPTHRLTGGHRNQSRQAVRRPTDTHRRRERTETA